MNEEKSIDARKYRHTFRMLRTLWSGVPAVAAAGREAAEFWSGVKGVHIRDSRREDWTPEETAAFWMGYAYQIDDLMNHNCSEIAKGLTPQQLRKIEEAIAG